MAAPLIEAGDITHTNNTSTATSSKAISYPAHSAGDLLIQFIISDAAVTHTLPGAGPNSETVNTIVEDAIGGSNGPCLSAIYWIASTNTNAGTLTWALSANESCSGECIVVPTGEFNATTPIGTIGSAGTSNVDAGDATMPAFTPNSSGGRVVAIGGCDADPMNNPFSPAGWTDRAGAGRDDGAQNSFVATRDAESVSGTEVGAAAFNINPTDSYACIGFVVNGPPQTITPPAGSLAAVGLACGLLLLGPDYQSITPDTGALHFGLETATSHEITPPAGELTAEGVAPSLGESFWITPPAGDLSLSGIAGRLGIGIGPPAGSLTGEGAAPTLRTDTRLTPPVGSAVVEGIAPSVDVSSATDTQRTPPSGSLDLAGVAPSLVLAEFLTPPSGELFFGLIPEASPSLTPGTASLAFVGELPGLGQTYTVMPPTGALTTEGSPPDLSITSQLTITPPVGSLDVTGYAPTLINPVDTSITPDAGALELIGAVPDIQTDTRIAPDAGAVSLAGAAPSLITPVGLSITPPAGAAAFTGSAPTLLVPIAITPPAGALAASGVAPSLRTPTSITPHSGVLYFGQADLPILTPAAGSLSIAGYAPSLVVEGGDQSIQPPSGALAAAGAAPTVSQGSFITPPSGALRMDPPTLEWTWTPTGGETITSWRFKYGRNSGIYTQYTDIDDETLRELPVRTVVTAGPGWWYIRAYAVGPSGEGSFSNELYVNPGIVELRLDTPRIPGTGALDLTGAAPTTVGGEQTTITPTTGSLTLAGVEPSVFLQTYRVPPSGSLTLAGVAPTLDAPQEITPPSGSLTATGVAPQVGADRFVEPPAGSLTVTGAAPTVQRSEYLFVVVTPQTGAATLTGSAPTLRTDTRLTPQTGSLAASGTAPSLLIPQAITPPSGSIVLSGEVPQAIIGPFIAPPTGSLDVASEAPTVVETGHTSITPPAGSLTVAGAAPYFVQTYTLGEDFRLREIPQRFTLIELPARSHLCELPPRYILCEIVRGVT